jgi:hypothetical protein
MKKRRAFGSAAPAVLLLLSACASSPSPAPSPAAAAAGKEPKRVSLVCHDKSTALRFDQIGVPMGERAQQVAVHGDETYILFRPGRLVRLRQQEGKARVEMSLAPAGETWTALGVDPADGSVWVASESFTLYRFDRDWKMKKVPIQRVAGSGGFSTLLVAPDALYARPFCAEDGIWRIDREGKILGSAFPAPPPEESDEPRRMDELRCSPVRLERDPEGNIVVWDYANQKLHRAEADGRWTEVPSGFFSTLQRGEAQASVVKGADIGGEQEQWYLDTPARDLFYWKDQPVFFGGLAARTKGGHNTVLLLPREDVSGFEELIESCYDLAIFDVATDGPRYAAITDRVVVFGDFATAPDLP